MTNDQSSGLWPGTEAGAYTAPVLAALPVAPPCQHVADGCGGCPSQHLPYAEQLVRKAGAVRAALAAVAGLEELRPRPIIPAPAPWGYRNKMELSFHARGGLGMHVKGKWDAVFSLERCFLPDPVFAALARAARAAAGELALPLHDPRRRHEGPATLRQLVLRRSEATGEVLCGLVTDPGDLPGLDGLAARLLAVDPRVVGVVRGAKAARNDGAELATVEPLAGRDRVVERLAGLSFEVRLQTFFQTNTAAAERLVAATRELIGPVPGDLLDLCCGVGTFALALAGQAKAVVGVEVVQASIDAARENAARNGIGNATFHAGAVRQLIPDILRGTPDVVVLDPPRNGLGGKVMRRVGRLGAPRLCYVSCNPRTLADDLREVLPFGYHVAAVQPVDLFPQTEHVETIALLERNPGPAPGVEASCGSDRAPGEGDRAARSEGP